MPTLAEITTGFVAAISAGIMLGLFSVFLSRNTR